MRPHMFPHRGHRRNRDPFFYIMLLQLLQQLNQLEYKPPFTLALMAVNFAAFFQGLLPTNINIPRFSSRSYCLQPYKILEGSQWSRLLISAFLHGDEAHLYYNMSSLMWKGAQLERRLGSLRFGALVAELLVVSHSLVVLLSWMLAESIPEYSGLYYRTCAVGFSAVLFGLKVVLNHDSPASSNILGITLPTKYLCWAELLYVQLLTPQASFLGHLCGIAAGWIHVRFTAGMWAALGSSIGHLIGGTGRGGGRAGRGAGRQFSLRGTTGSGLLGRHPQQQAQGTQPYRGTSSMGGMGNAASRQSSGTQAVPSSSGTQAVPGVRASSSGWPRSQQQQQQGRHAAAAAAAQTTTAQPAATPITPSTHEASEGFTAGQRLGSQTTHEAHVLTADELRQRRIARFGA